MSFALVQMRSQSERQIINQLESVAELKQEQITRWLESDALVMQSFLVDAEMYAQMVAVSTSSGANTPAQTSLNVALRTLSTCTARTMSVIFADSSSTIARGLFARRRSNLRLARSL